MFTSLEQASGRHFHSGGLYLMTGATPQGELSPCPPRRSLERQRLRPRATGCGCGPAPASSLVAGQPRRRRLPAHPYRDGGGSKLSFVAERFFTPVWTAFLSSAPPPVSGRRGPASPTPPSSNWGGRPTSWTPGATCWGAGQPPGVPHHWPGGQARSPGRGILVGAGSVAHMRGIIFADGEQHFDHETLQDHIGPQASSDLFFKVVVKNRQRCRCIWGR